MHPRVAGEIGGNGAPGDVVDNKVRKRRLIKMEAAGVGREQQHPLRSKPADGVHEQRHMVSLHIEHQGFSAPRVRERGRIEEDHVV
jgi:hypothetical protein